MLHKLILSLVVSGLFGWLSAVPSVAAKNDPFRLIYFIGNKNQQDSRLITQVYAGHYTLAHLFCGEFATRTLSNLYNLHAARGPLNEHGELVYDGSMTGPHHYYGWIDPFKAHTLTFDDGFPVFTSHNATEKIVSTNLQSVPEQHVVKIENYTWLPGSKINDEVKKLYNVHADTNKHLVNTDNGDADSLFIGPGILELEENNLTLWLFTSGRFWVYSR